MLISGMSGNEIFCLAQKGLFPGEIAVGNSVRSMGVGGSIGASFQSMATGEIGAITQLISEGRHAAISRMEDEAKRRGAIGVTGVISELTTLAGYTEFLSQGTGVHVQSVQPGQPFFSTSASGTELYCHIDAGYQPVKFVMGNVAYALGIGGGIMGSLRTMAQGEVTEYSQLYNGIRHLALQRLQAEAAALGANSVVDIRLDMLPFGPAGTIELLMTGTASYNPRLSQGPVAPDQVVTSELTGEELWNLAKLGFVPQRLVMATSVYSLGIAAGIGTMFKSMSRGELPEVTHLVYKARENCLDLIRREAQAIGAERVIGNKLIIRELGPGLIEIIAVGTAIRPHPNSAPETPHLIPQAVIQDRDMMNLGGALPLVIGARARGAPRAIGCLIVLVMIIVGAIVAVFIGLLSGN
ncbi:heavy metal-binding domain-containing protein [Pendulispora albinea]|uniref:YbjQ family protein n=1 Tax=Pendulispora albinea TaxID=2741071 RepID=A0ABZ2LM63_9BACT